MRQLIETYNELAQQFEDWMFKRALPPIFKTIELSMRVLLVYAFYLLVKNALTEAL